MTGNGSTIQMRIKKLLRSPSIKHKKRRKESLACKVTLEKVLGITASGNSGLACDPRSGLVAYPAGCVVVLLNPKKNKQNHIINASRKTLTALSFSPDGKYLATGESGHLPAVRLWNVAERRQVAELQQHKYGVACVAFSPNGKYIVSVGNQHDMMVNVWAWKKDVIVAVNKVSSKVTSVSFSEDSAYFVTAGNRHVKFWYLDPCKTTKASAPLPLLGRSGLLGELRNNLFCDVACGRGSKADSTFCITSSGLLCEFNSRRMLDRWVDLRTGAAQSLSLSDDLIFCGCVDGTVRAFSPADLRFVCTLPRPHPLGTDVSVITQASQLSSTKEATRYPDASAVTYDPASRWLSCVYSDHSLYVWDVRDVQRVGKVHSALFHAACVWDLQMFPEASEESHGGWPPGVFLSCSSDDTIRLWCPERPGHALNLLSNDLLGVIYVDGGSAALLDAESTAGVNAGEGQAAESRTGIRSICVSPDGNHLASGDRNGILRVYDLRSMEEILKVEAHDAEILCLEYSKPETGLKLLATAGRDRLIHVLDAQDNYSLLQTLDEHSSSITAIRFAASDDTVRMVSCGADKSIYFHTAHRTHRGAEFRRTHHVVRKTTLYDMDVDPTSRYAAVACQDRCVRIFSISSGKQKKLYKGSLSEDGSLLRVQMDPSGLYVATSCSDKNINIYDFRTGECVATMFGHSEIVTGMKFTSDCKHLISVSGDSCVFVWRLAPELTHGMRERLGQLRGVPGTLPYRTSAVGREPHGAPSLGGMSSDSDRELEDDASERGDPGDPEDLLTNSSSDGSQGEHTGGSDEGLDWESSKVVGSSPATPDPGKQPRRRWSDRMGSLEVMVKSMLDLRQLEQRRSPASKRRLLEAGGSFSLQESKLADRPKKKQRPRSHGDWLSFYSPKETQGSVLYPDESGDRRSLQDGDYMVKERHSAIQGRGDSGGESQDIRSPDSACYLGYDSREGSSDHCADASEGVEALSDDGSDEEHEEEDYDDDEEGSRKTEVTTMDEALRTVTEPPARGGAEEDFLRQNFEMLADGGSTAAQSTAPRSLSMSARFLAGAHNNRSAPMLAKAQGKEPGSPAAKPPVSKVRPLMEDGRSGGGTEEDQGPVGVAEGGAGAEGDAALLCWPQKTKTKKKTRLPGAHLWRLSHPSVKAPLLAEAALQGSQSVEDLNSNSPSPPRPQHLPPAGCRHAPHLPPPPCSASPLPPAPPPPLLPWESPRPLPRRSYMSPTTSSRAKCSRSCSLGEELQATSPPPSPSYLRRRMSSGLLVFEPPRPSSPVSSCSRSLTPSWSCPPACSLGPPPAAAAASPPASLVSPSHSAPPSRIPLPRRNLEAKAHSDWSDSQASAAIPVGERDARPATQLSGTRGVSRERDRYTAASAMKGPSSSYRPFIARRLSPSHGHRSGSLTASVADSTQNGEVEQSRTNAVLGRQMSLNVDASSSLPARETSRSVSGSVKDPEPSVVAGERPLVAAKASTLPQNLYPDQSITVETCKQAIAELHSSLRRAALLYTTLLGCDAELRPDRREMRRALADALGAVRAELDRLSSGPVVPPGGGQGDCGVKGEGDRALALLEQYSELLLKSVEKRLETSKT